jgi:hypothetical protein
MRMTSKSTERSFGGMKGYAKDFCRISVTRSGSHIFPAIPPRKTAFILDGKTIRIHVRTQSMHLIDICVKSHHRRQKASVVGQCPVYCVDFLITNKSSSSSSGGK